MRSVLGLMLSAFSIVVVRGVWLSIRALRRGEDLPPMPPMIEPAFPDIDDAP
jgi:hypothetical protein